MRLLTQSGCRAGSAILAAVLAGCSGTSVQTPSAGLSSASNPVPVRGVAQRGWMLPQAAGTGLVYVSEYNTNDVAILRQSDLSRVGSITSGVNGPQGLYVDAHKNLYLANAGSTVEFYPSGSITPTITYSQGLNGPIDVVAGKDGTVYVANFNGANGYVTEYPPGSTTPSLQVTTGFLTEGIALDAANNMYVSYRAGNGSESVLMYAPGASTGTDLGLTGLSGGAGGILIDQAGALVVVDQGGAIDVFPPGSVTASKVLSGLSDPFKVALGHTRKKLYCADASSGILHVFAYPSGRPITNVTGLNGPRGVATSPDAPFGPGPW
jgi:hypothetical protein